MDERINKLYLVSKDSAETLGLFFCWEKWRSKNGNRRIRTQ